MIQRVVVAVLLIGLVLITLYRLPLVCWLVLGNLFLLLAAREYTPLTSPQPALSLGLLLGPLLALPWLWVYAPIHFIPLLVMMWLVIAFGALLGAPELARVGPTAAAAVMGLLYLGLPVTLAADYHPAAGGQPDSLLLLFLLVWTSDAAAFAAGRWLGRHRITPRLSPNKTLEGYLGALGAPALAALVLVPAWLGSASSRPAAAGLGLVIGLAAIGGDLFESALKRGAGVKDSSQLLPGHGGVLDRIDSFLFALPTYTVVLPWIMR